MAIAEYRTWCALKLQFWSKSCSHFSINNTHTRQHSRKSEATSMAISEDRIWYALKLQFFTDRILEDAKLDPRPSAALGSFRFESRAMWLAYWCLVLNSTSNLLPQTFQTSLLSTSRVQKPAWEFCSYSRSHSLRPSRAPHCQGWKPRICQICIILSSTPLWLFDV